MTQKTNKEIVEKVSESVLRSPYADGSLTAREDTLIDLAVRKAISIVRKEYDIENDEWLTFAKIGQTKKTKIYEIKSKCDKSVLGEVKWYPKWRNYCFITPEFVFSDRCLMTLARFVHTNNLEHRLRKKTGGK